MPACKYHIGRERNEGKRYKKMNYYIASCVFTTKYPDLSFRIREYIRRRGDISIVRCCVPKYKLKEFTEKLPEQFQHSWTQLPDSADFGEGDIVYSLCHNCSAIIDEWKTGVRVRSLWELIDEDEDFLLPDYNETPMFVQDCWRAKDRTEEQDAVRSLMRKMNIRILEREDSRDRTDFCGISLYRPAPPRNLKLAPKRFVEGAAGKYEPHTEEEQRELMEAYVRDFHGEKVVSYCHYCQEGLLLGGADASHLAMLLFES